MTNLFFIRHAESDIKIKDDSKRPLTIKGINDCQKIPIIFEKIDLDHFYCSPYIRSVETIRPLANQRNEKIIICENFRERIIGSWVDDFLDYSRKQWKNFDFKVDNGESLSEVRKRNLKEINNLLNKHPGQNIVIGTHGTALCSIINYYEPKMGYDFFLSIVDKMPFIIKMEFNDMNYISMKEINLEDLANVI